MFKINVVIDFVFFTSLQASAQSTGSWNILNLRMDLNKGFSLFGEAQLRSLKYYDDFHYHEFKAGLNYRVHKNLLVSMAAGKYDTYGEGGNFELPKNNAEIRLWPQVLISQEINKLKVENSFRTEMRFTTNGYRNRFRNRFGVAYPLFPKKNLELGVYNELFFTNNEPYFERNRISVNVTYKLNPSNAFMLGFLSQFDYKINDETGKNFIQVGYYHSIVRKK
jgi:hypothetical protein